MRKSRHRNLTRLGWVFWVLLQPTVLYGVEEGRPDCSLGSGVACAPPVVKLGEGTGASGRFTRIELERRRAMLVETPFDVSRVAVGDAKIADVIVVSPRQVNIVPLRIGETNLLLWDSEGALSAAIELEVGNKHFRLERELRRILSNQTIRLEGDQGAVVLMGTVESPIEMRQVVEVTEGLVAARIEESGGVASGGQAAGADRVINMLRVGGNQQVMIEVIVAEMNRTLRRNLGTNFAGVYKSGSTEVNFFSFLQDLSSLSSAAPKAIDLSSRVNFVSAISKGSKSLDLFIEAIQSDGLIKILAEPNLVARSGESAEFLVGGEVPIPIPQSGNFGAITIEFKQFGVAVNFTPTVLASNRIYMDVSTEVSEPDLTLGVDAGGFTVPAFKTRRAATAVELRDGESFAIAGLLRDDITESVNEFPGLAEIPILGVLFRSTQFERKKSELVVIATPRLVEPLPAGRPALPTDHLIVPSALDLFFFGSLEGTSPDSHPDSGGAAESASTDRIRAPRMGGDQDARSFSLAVSEKSEAFRAINEAMAGEVGHVLDITRAEEEL